MGTDVHEFFVPVSHFSSRVPEGTVHSYEITPSFLLQCFLELFSSHGVRPYDIELVVQLSV